jgi:hypothetical protein
MVRALLLPLLLSALELRAADALGYLQAAADRFHRTIDVYTDDGAAGNHFLVRARSSSFDDDRQPEAAARAVPAMQEDSTERPYSGATCIRASFRSQLVRGLPNWGAWSFMHGALRDGRPEPDWGETPEAGMNLSGARRLTFRARGEKGGERVEFFALGVGWDADRRQRNAPHPDSAPAVKKKVTLSAEWQPYSIDLQKADLSYVIGGFGWAANAAANGLRDITFYLDDIRYELDDRTAAARVQEPHFVVSYETHGVDDLDRVMRNSAHTYDNALVLLAFLAAGDTARAGGIADALVEAQAHDRFRPVEPGPARIYRDSVRNAYQGGDLFTPPGWTRPPSVRLPGWREGDQWREDAYSVSLDTGNTAWAMIALLAYHDAVVKQGDSRYLRAAKQLGEWVERNCASADGLGYTGGYNGWEPAPRAAQYRSTEHNLDLYAAFERLSLITGDEIWHERARRARRFVMSMWHEADGMFWTGTDGPVNRKVIPLDVQAWAGLALRDLPREQALRALAYTGKHMRTGKAGYDYSRRACTGEGTSCDDRQGVWYEGTAQMAVAYHHQGDTARAREILAALKNAQAPSGALFASDQTGGLLTGFERDGQRLRYFKRPHIGATAWLVFAERGVNPYWLGR